MNKSLENLVAKSKKWEWDFSDLERSSDNKYVDDLFKYHTVRQILKRKHNVSDLNEMLLYAAIKNNLEDISLLIMHGANDLYGLFENVLKSKENAEFLIDLLGYNDEILDIVSEVYYPEFFKVALNKGLDPNHTILFACRYGINRSIVEYLIDNGAWDLNPALYFASLSLNNTAMIQMLLNRGAWDVHFALYGIYAYYGNIVASDPNVQLLTSFSNNINEYSPPNNFFESLRGSNDMSTSFLIKRLKEAKQEKEIKTEYSVIQNSDRGFAKNTFWDMYKFHRNYVIPFRVKR